MKKVQTFFYASVMVLGILGLSYSANANRICAILYQNSDFEGAYLVASEAMSINNDLGDCFNDVISSVYLSEGCFITLCDDVNLEGDCITLTESADGLDGFNDETESYQCECFQ